HPRKRHLSFHYKAHSKPGDHTQAEVRFHGSKTDHQKLLFPLILFIMPAVFIMIFGPVILGFIGAK
ncbi:hypothetical protein EBT16_09275, partial [bacterium]|nr:hypothetical protein [bacterium]